jgi:Zn finger protein HypA/HybF involved in hydrogenase expression
MAAEPVRCTNCGHVLDHTVQRTVEKSRVVRCERCPKRKYALSENDRQFLKGMRIKVD